MNNLGITDFLSKISARGIASPNKYRVVIHPPSGIQPFAQAGGVSDFALSDRFQIVARSLNLNGSIDIMATQVSLPSRMLDLMEIRTYGPKQRLPFGVSTAETVQMMFLTSGSYNERLYFEIWQSIIANIRSNTMNYPNEYVGRVEIIAIDREGNDVYKVLLEDAYPSSVQQIDLSYATVNTSVYTPVAWAFKNWSSPTKLGG